MSQSTRPRYTLRDLPLPAKLVVSTFLMAVGLGYFSALVQLHIAHSDQQGSPLPTPDDVVKRFSYFELHKPGEPPKSHVEELISGHREDGWGPSNMTPAFFSRSSGYQPYAKMKPSDPARKAVDDQREGERKALIAFINMDPDKRAEAYRRNEMPFPEKWGKHPITPAYVLGDLAGGPPKSQIERLVSGPRDGELTESNMTPAFFEKSPDYARAAKRNKAKVDAEREGERLAVVASTRLPAAKQRAAYEADAMDLPAGMKDQPITEDYVDGDKVMVKSILADRCGRCHDNQQAPNFPDFAALQPLITPPPPREPAIKVTSIINDRCGRCHNENQAPQFPDYASLEPLITPAPAEQPREAFGQKWVGSSSTMKTSELVRSTHAHALSFAVLFGLTGFIYAFSSHPGFFRGLLAPVVLFAQVLDVSCWWLARLDLDHGGPLFALAIMGTGGVVGLGLTLQIVLSLFDMYGLKGKAVLVLFLLAGAAILGTVYAMAIHPSLEEQKRRALTPTEVEQPEEPPPQPQDPGRGGKRVQDA